MGQTLTTLFLGRVEIPSDGQRHPNAHVQPLFSTTTSTRDSSAYSMWTPIVNRHKQFPNRGLVTWFNPPPEATKNTIWQFTVEETNFDSSVSHHSAFKIRLAPTRPEEIIDLRSLGGEDHARTKIVHEGIILSFVPSGRVYLWVDDKTWIGPVQLLPITPSGLRNIGDRNTWNLDTAQPLMCFKPAQDELIQYLKIDEERIFLSPNASPGPRLGQVDWGPIGLVLRRLLQRLQKIDPSYTRDLGLTSKLLARMTETIEVSGLAGINAYLDEHRVKRAQEVVHTLEVRQALFEKLIDEIIKLPVIKSEIENVKLNTRKEAEQQLREELSETIALIEASRKEVDLLDKKKEETSNAISSLQEQLESQVQSFEERLEIALHERFTKISAQSEEVLADSIILRAALGIKPANLVMNDISPSSQKGSVNTESCMLQFPSWSCQRTASATDVTSPTELRRDLGVAVSTKGLDQSMAGCLHSAFIAGSLPVIAGSGAYDALESYASVVAGGRLLWLPISVGTLEPTDLLGRFQEALSRFVPQAGGLLDLLLLAEETNELYIVVLDGINRAAVDAYLTPLISCYADAWNKDKQRKLPFFSRNLVLDDDPYAPASSLKWPSNVLIAGILVEGVATVAPPPSFWDSCILLNTSQFECQEIAQRIDSYDLESQQLKLRSVPKEYWGNWRNNFAHKGKVSNEVLAILRDLAKNQITLSQDNLLLGTRFFSAMQEWADDADALDAFITHYLIPRAVAAGQEEVLLATLGRLGLASQQIDATIIAYRQILL
ncbi:MAG: hypothetical protein LC803_18450 [Acidobacteria bacterium]|nr:hypothetical protein [Acidobacteriota bacterium]